jgi:hypothetical protein
MQLDRNPWVNMWFRPRSTIRSIVEFSPNYGLKVLSFIYGFASLLSLAQTFSLGFFVSFTYLMILMLIAAPFWGYFIFTFVSWVVYRSGRWLKGRASHKEVRAVLAWSNIPMTVNLLIWASLIYVFRGTLFQGFPGTYLLVGKMFYLLFALSVTQMIMGIWSLVLYINALAEVQGFSIVRAIGNLLIAGFLFVLGFVILAGLFLYGTQMVNKMIYSL